MANKEANLRTAPSGDYDVFLSFRGPDTRDTFADCLYLFMKNSGIRVFRDDEELQPGEKISEILRAVENSQIYIPIFSKDYASSRWCLRELKCMVESHGRSSWKRILPIFYDVEPGDVKVETELYQSALTKHEKELGCIEVKQWKKALTTVARIKGWHMKDRRHGEVIEDIVKEVLHNITTRKRDLPTHLVGIEHRVADIQRLLNCCDTGDVRFVIIHGIGGMGKTTLAKAVFNQLSPQFEGHSFLSNIQDHGIVKMQRRLAMNLFNFLLPKTYDFEEGNNVIRKRLPNKRVLLVFDGMDENGQCVQLAKCCTLCGPGSRIIITTQDKSVFSMTKMGGFEENISTRSIEIIPYEMKEMHLDHALQLFNKHAFNTNSAPPDLYDLSKEVVQLTGGLPLAVEVIGLDLRGQKQAKWISIVKKLKDMPPTEVLQRLKISYDTLDDCAQQIYLDIACFFVNKKKTLPMYMWEACGYHPEVTIDVLINKSLIKIVDCDIICMHNLLRDVGREIVRRETVDRSRSWCLETAHEKGIENAVGLTPRRTGDNFTCKYFADLTNARFLKLDGGNFIGNFEDILPKLRWLCWQSCPPELQAKNFVLNCLVILKLSGDIIIDKWSEWVEIMVASKLKVLKIARSKSLIKTPCFSEFMSLERLVLEDFPNLVQIDHSIGKLEQLIYLKIKWCPLLRGLPLQIGCLNALRELILIQGFSICYLPNSIGNLRLLSRLVVEDAGLVELPSTIKGLADLEYLSLANCTSLNSLLYAIGELKSLTELDLSGTTIEELPHSIYNFADLTLRINNSKIRTLLMGDLPSLEGIEDCFNSIRIQADWKSAPKNLKGVPLEEIQQKLMFIYKGLEYGEKVIFLYIASSFLSKKNTEAVYIQEGCADFPKVEIDALVNKSLIKITDHGKIWMHDLVRDFVGEIIPEEIFEIGSYHIWLCSRINGKGKSKLKILKGSGHMVQMGQYLFCLQKTISFLEIVDVKEWITNRMLVASLMVAVNFTAVFTDPRRVNSGDIAFKEDWVTAATLDLRKFHIPVMLELRMFQIPLMLELRMFQILVICHIMATICSVIAYIHLILAEKSDCHTAIVASKHATALLIIALLPVLIAFLAFVILTHEKLPSLVVATYCLGFVLFVLLILGATWSEVVFIWDLVRLLRRLFWITRKRRA